jgi:hypothetical protein
MLYARYAEQLIEIARLWWRVGQKTKALQILDSIRFNIDHTLDPFLYPTNSFSHMEIEE